MRRTRDPGTRGTAEVRRRIAVEAARLLTEQGMRDFHQAKSKAALNLGLGDNVALPRNDEVEDALREHQRLFHSDAQPARLAQLRHVAIEAMGFLQSFQPRLVGAVLEGTADHHSAVCLHVFADNPREVMTFLSDQRIPFAEETRRLRSDQRNERDYPVLSFLADDIAIDLTVFNRSETQHAPLDRITLRPMRRANLAYVTALGHAVEMSRDGS
ncbi:MAG: hypothetical protein ABIY56_11200 [Dokdonella sp.]